MKPRAIQFPSYPMTVNLYSSRKHVINDSSRIECLPNYMTQAFFLLECRVVELTRVETSSMSTKSSTNHSYQTIRSSVCRHILTSSSLLSGNCIGP
jgi:hypothetical protein